jgi:hypothetical protein|tara:strand:- start:2479 stop:2880 length:402 start_codon:yes stop_codon:yes gene_type:complete
MADQEYIQIEDEKGVYDCTNSLTGICDDVVASSVQLSVLVKEKHKLFSRAKVLSTALINDLHALNKYMKKTGGKTTTARAKRVITKKTVSKKVKVKKAVRKKVAKKTVSKRTSSKNSMKTLRANLKKIDRALH